MKYFLVFLMLLFGFNSVQADNIKTLPSQIGIVQRIEYVDFNVGEDLQTKQAVEIKLISGNLKNSVITVDNMLTGNPYYDIKLKKGVKVILHVEDNDGILMYSIEDVKRSNVLALLSFLFVGLLLYVGKIKGLYSLFAIILTCVLIYWGLSPLILSGVDPIISTMLICILSAALTMYLVGGFNRKSTSAAIGSVLSLSFSGVIAGITVKLAHLTGLTYESSMFLYSAHPELNFVSIAVSMMILASMGAVMDVGMSIASTVNEISVINKDKTIKELFLSGMNVGRDIIGTMANTLILVYVGGSLPLLLLVSNIDFQKLLNLNQVVTEIASALIGSSAIIICVPITAIVASTLVKSIPEKISFSAFETKLHDD